MRPILMLYLIVAQTGVAAAHTLPDGEPLAAQISHQLLGFHHLAFLLLVPVVAMILYRGRKFRAGRHGPP